VAGAVPTNTVSTGYSATGSFGVEYAISSRFVVFGELGYGYTRAKNTFNGATAITAGITNATGVRTAVGVIVYF
jgi:hypothetical protein